MSFDHTILKGTTSKIIEISVKDTVSAQGKTGIAHTDVTASYVREGSTRTAITLASGSAGDAYSSGKWAEVDSTNCRGLYQLHIPDAALATGVNAVTITLQSTGMVDKAVRIALIDADLRNAGWDNFHLSSNQIIPGTVDTVTNTHTPTTTEFQADDITEATADHYNGRIIIFTSGNLNGQATIITDYSQVGGIGQFTVNAMTEAPANNDTFIIV